MVLTSASRCTIVEAFLETNVYAGADQQKLEHKVINGLLEKFPVRCPLGWFLPVCSEMRDSRFEVSGDQPPVDV